MSQQTMKAVRIVAHGGLDALEYEDHPIPEPQSDDLLVRVLSTSVSGWDLKYRRGEIGAGLPGRKKFPLPMQPGRDAAGVVEAIGKDVRDFKVGDRVVGLVHPSNPASPMTIRGLGNLSTNVDYPGHTMFGGNAQFVVRPSSYWLRLPDHVAPSDAAASMWAYATSHRILMDRLRSRPGDSVLIIGASGGMGSATLDLARLAGLRVVATTRSRSKRDFLKQRGADEVMTLGSDDDVAALRDLAPTLGFDGAVDYSGDERMLRLCVDTLRPGGTLVLTSGEKSSSPIPIMAGDFVRLELNVCGARASTLNDQRVVLEMLSQGRIKPAIHATLPMSAVRDAHAALEGGDITGRILLDPWA